MTAMKFDSKVVQRAMSQALARNRSVFLSPGQVARIARSAAPKPPVTQKSAK